jgi:DNA recombination protein RmuC
LAAEKAGSQARLDELHSSHLRLKAEFAQLSAEALRISREDFMKQAEQTFTAIQAKSAGDLEIRQKSIDALVKPLKESLDKVDTKIADLEKTRASAYGQLGQQLESLQKDQKNLQDQTAKLTNVLSTTRAAGTWGEVQLRRVVELSGLVEHVDFKQQHTASGESGRADMVVFLPRGQQIVVDAKAPTDDYRSAAGANEPAERLRFLKEHASKVKKHITDLGDRAYWAHYTPSPEFVVLFLPGDQFLSAALEADPTLIDFAIDRKVLLATPTTLIALLKAAAYGWRQEAISKNAEEISAVGRELYNRIVTFAEHLAGVSRGLEAASKAFNKAAGSFEASLLPGARKFEELGAKGIKDLELPETIETAAREITKRA